MNEFSARDGNNCPEMWAGGSWQQWPLQPSMFQNIPHEEIDWAALAQQWIQMRETMGGPSKEQQQQQQPPPPLAPPNPSVANSEGIKQNLPKNDNTVDSLDESSDSQGDWNYWNNSNWNMTAPPAPWNSAAAHANDVKESLPPSFEFGQAHGNQGFAAQTYDYNHGSDVYGYNQVFVDQSQFPQYWPGGQPGSVPFQRKDRRISHPDREGTTPTREDEDMVTLPPPLDAAKRKQLPAWIREGLEKVERDKQKKLERERLQKEREEQLKSMKEAEERAMKELRDNEDESTLPQKSKFESESEDDETDRKSPSPLEKRLPSPEEEEPKSEEERMANLMIRVRRMLTEILLEVTNEELHQVAREVYQRAKVKAPAMQLATSSALASLTGGLGLGEYGSDNSEESAAEEEEAVDSDLELQANIRQRKKEFAEKEREIVATLRNQESDVDSDETNDAKNTLATEFLQPSPEREKYHFEKKYNEIPGLDVAPDNDENKLKDKRVTQINSEREKDSDKDRKSQAETDKTLRSESDSDRGSSTSSSSRARDSGRRSRHNKSQPRSHERSKSRDRARSGSRRSRSDSHDRRETRKRRSRSRSRSRRRYSRSRSRDRRRSRSGSGSKGRVRRNRSSFNRDRSNSRDRRQRRRSYSSKMSSRDHSRRESFRKERVRRSSKSRSPSTSRRSKKESSQRSSRSYTRSRSPSPSPPPPTSKKLSSSSNKRDRDARESRSASCERGGSGKKSSRKQTTS